MKEKVLRSLIGIVGEKRMTACEINYEVKGRYSGATHTTVRKAIRDLIADGTPIGSDQGGFYLITEREEYEDVLEGLQARCDAIQQRIADITTAYTMLRASRHADVTVDIKDRCRFYVNHIAETTNIPYQAVYVLAYRKLQKITKIDLVTLPDWYQGSVLNFVVNKGHGKTLYSVLEELEKGLV